MVMMNRFTIKTNQQDQFKSDTTAKHFSLAKHGRWSTCNIIHHQNFHCTKCTDSTEEGKALIFQSEFKWTQKTCLPVIKGKIFILPDDGARTVSKILLNGLSPVFSCFWKKHDENPSAYFGQEL